MKRIIPLLLALLLLPCLSRAQKTLEFYYFAHDHFGKELRKVVDEVRFTARYNESRTVIFYLANGNKPVYFKVSTDDEKAYSEFIEELNDQVSHLVYPEVDRQTICDILSGGRFLPTSGFDSYDHVLLNYFISSSFVQQDFDDAVIGRLYWDMDLDQMPRSKCQIRIYCAPGERIKEDSLFGSKIGKIPVLLDTF